MRAVLNEKLAVAKERFQRKLARKLEFKMHGSSEVVEPRIHTEKQEGKGDAVFLELFAGEAGLTKAVQKLGYKVLEPGDINVGGNVKVQLDLRNNNHFKALKKLIKTKQVRWLHLAPPCKTFSRARRSDGLMRLKRLRNRGAPRGPRAEVRSGQGSKPFSRKSSTAGLAPVQIGGCVHLRESGDFVDLEIQACSKTSEAGGSEDPFRRPV